MTNEELTDLVTKITERLSLTIQALDGLREIVELQSQRLDNLESKLFGPMKERYE